MARGGIALCKGGRPGNISGGRAGQILESCVFAGKPAPQPEKTRGTGFQFGHRVI